MKKKYSLWMRLSVLFILVLGIIVSLFYGVFLHQNSKFIHRSERELLKATTAPLVSDEEIILALKENTTTIHLQNRMAQLAQAYHFDFIVIMNMDGNRLTHPDPNEIGKHFKGGDEGKALKGDSLFSTSKGTLGTSLRYFTPINDEHQQQVGVIAIGVKQTTLSELLAQSQDNYTIALLISSIAGLVMAAIVAFYLKRQLHDLEPGEAYRLIEERNAMLEETKDAVFFINLTGHVLLANRAAAAMVLKPKQIFTAQQSLYDFFPMLKGNNFDRKVSQNFRFNNKDYIISSAPVNVNRHKIGYILFFRNATDTIFVLDQLANTTAYATSLQTQTHEFMNKLHIIYGLVDLKAYDELRYYLETILQPDTAFINQITLLVKDPVLASFFIGEREKFSERKSKLLIDLKSEIALDFPEDTRGILINLLRFVDLHLLQLSLPQTMTLSIDELDHSLFISYTLPSSSESKVYFDHVFDDYYFKQLLLDLPGTFAIKEDAGTILFDLTYTRKE